ncbi:MAG: citrate (Si)-synthase, partial [Candidatus Puniceispirillaceae bacterium]
MATDANSKKTITVTNDETGDSFALSTLQGSIGPDVIDIRDLYAKSGMFTFDPGYGATGSC